MSKPIGTILYSDSRHLFCDKSIDCSACLINKADHYHHIIPFVDGGRTVIPVCETCHNKIHGLNFNNHSENIKLGIEKARLAGKQIGKKMKNYDIMKFMELHNNGLSYRQIAKEMKISVGTVCNLFKRHYKNE